MFKRLTGWMKGKDSKYWKDFAIHWTIAGVLIGAGLLVGEWLGDHQYWIDLRYGIHQYLTSNKARPAHTHRTVMVIIGDEEYWQGELAGRVPVKRAYLTKLVNAIDTANPEVLAIDVDLRSPMPDGSPVNYTDYQAETDELLQAIKATSARRTIVLPKTLGYDEGYVFESDVYDNAGLSDERVLKGYIALPDDLRNVPMALELKDGGRVDSFAEAIVRASEPAALKGFDKNSDSLPYGNFLGRDEFPHYTASQVLSGDPNVLKNLAHKIVIVGGAWQSRAYKRGDGIDIYYTPVGFIPGAFIHANYVEALLDSRTSSPLGDRMGMGVEIVFALSVAIILTLNIRKRWKFLFLILVPIVLVLFSYFSWQNLGMFFDFFIPLVLLGVHFIIEHWLHLENEVRHLRREAHKPQSQAHEPV